MSQRKINMRWLFLLLLITNLAYITWEMQKPPEISPMKTTAVNRVPALVLISEIEPVKDDVRPTDKVPAGASKDAAVADVVPAEAVVAVKENNEVVSVDERPVETKPTDEPAEKPVEQTAVVIKQDTQPDIESCYTLGPFRELDSLRAFTRQIKDYVDDVSFRSREEREISLFWV